MLAGPLAFNFYVVFVYVLVLHESYELCTAFYVDIYETVRNTHMLTSAIRGDTFYRRILFIRDFNTLQTRGRATIAVPARCKSPLAMSK